MQKCERSHIIIIGTKVSIEDDFYWLICLFPGMICTTPKYKYCYYEKCCEVLHMMLVILFLFCMVPRPGLPCESRKLRQLCLHKSQHLQYPSLLKWQLPELR